MPRKPKAGAAEDIMSIVASLPWWLGVILAFFFYFVLHEYAVAPMSASTAPGEMGRVATYHMIRTMAGIAQYLLPFLLLIGAATSAYRRWRRRALLGSIATGSESGALAALHSMSWREFEMVIGQWFRTQGYTVVEQGGGGADGGIDLILKKDSEQFLVQCKQWRATKVGVTIVRELFGVMAAQGATGGFVIAAGAFTNEAKTFASGRNIELIDGQHLARIMCETTRPGTSSEIPPASSHSRTPACPKCSGPMVRRTAGRGGNSGQQFWGCTNYPQCKGALPFLP